MTVTKETFFKPDKQPVQDQGSQADAKAKNIVAAEAVEREKKTEKLRALRLAQSQVNAKP